MASWRQEGFRFVIYSDDHTPSHVHVFREKAQVIIKLGILGDNGERPKIRENKRMQPRDAIKALKICIKNQKEFLEKWEKVHGSK